MPRKNALPCAAIAKARREAAMIEYVVSWRRKTAYRKIADRGPFSFQRWAQRLLQDKSGAECRPARLVDWHEKRARRNPANGLLHAILAFGGILRRA